MRWAKHVLPWWRIVTTRPARLAGPQLFSSDSPALPSRSARSRAQCVTGYRPPNGSTPARRRVAIPGLRAFVLALDDDPGRQVRDAYGRVGGVDPLPARPRCAEHVHPELVLLHVHLDVVDLGDDGHRGEARLPAARGVER